MTEINQAYWMAFAHAKGFSNRRKMDFLINVIHNKVTLEEAMIAIKNNDKLGFDFSDKEWNGIRDAAYEIANYSFLAEQLLGKGISIVNVMDKNLYPQILKNNLGKESPILIYIKGNHDLLKRKCTAIVGARKSSLTSLEFTRNVANSVVKRGHVIVSGFAKGVDKCALDSALHFKGQSIIVLPQGIDTYSSKTYYPHIVKGNVTVISIYHPKAPWSIGLAMDRNKIIYGLSNEIYAAESNSSGGTWEGVINGLKRGRKVFVRFPDKKEKNANNLLINKGAVPVDFNGNEFSSNDLEMVSEEIANYKINNGIISNEEIVQKTIELLKEKNGKGITIKEIAEKFSLEENTKKKLNRILNSRNEFIKEKKGRSNLYYLANLTDTQGSLF